LAKEEKKMTYCKVGDLAITVNAYNPENIGKIVKIVGVVGLIEWYGFDSKTWVWEVETEGAPLAYQFGNDPKKKYVMRGEAPDAYLRPIRKNDQEQQHEDEEVLCV
jgi:hypothetical protein